MSPNERFALDLLALAGRSIGEELVKDDRPNWDAMDTAEAFASTGEQGMIQQAGHAWRGSGFVGMLGRVDSQLRAEVLDALTKAYQP